MIKKSIRLDKYLSHIGYGSRSAIHKLIKQKKVKVDGKVAVKIDMPIIENETVVTVSGQEVVYKEFYYFILHKPMGVITATEDRRQETVLDLLEEEDQNKKVAPVGRLDKDTEGLLILTNDGKFTHSLLSPKKHVPKVYYAKVEGKVVSEDIRSFEEGIVLSDGTRCLPAKLAIISANVESEIYITIEEGKFHQVKRMMESVGKKVFYLKRIQMGNLKLPEDLALGTYRELTEEEVNLLKGE